MNINKPKLLVLTSSYPKYKGDINGNFVFELATRLKSDFDIFVLAPAYRESLNIEIIDDIKIYRHKQFFLNNVELAYGSDILAKIRKNYFYLFVVPVFLFFQFFAIQRIVKKEKIQLIHAHWLIPQGFLAVVYKTIFNRNIKIITTIHGADINSFDNLFGRKLKSFILKNIDELTVVSNAIKEKAINLGYKKTVYVYPMGVDTKLFTPEKKDQTIRIKHNIEGLFLLFVGGLIERKGIRYLIQAIPTVIKEFPDVKLVVIGDGNLKSELIELTKHLNISENITFLGSVPHDDLPPYFATANLFILPSFSEGWPVVVMEALSSGTSTIVTNIPVFEKHEHKDQLFTIVPVGNFELIAKEINRLLLNKETLLSSQNILENYAKSNFDWGKIAEKYKNLINSLIN